MNAFQKCYSSCTFLTPPFFFLSLCFWFFLYRLTQYLHVAALQRTPYSFKNMQISLVSLSLSLSLCVCVLLGVGVHMWCIYDIPPSPFLFASLYGMIRMLSNDWGIATWQPRESLLRGWLARNVGWMILSWLNIRLIGLYGRFQCLDSVNGKQSSACRE